MTEQVAVLANHLNKQYRWISLQDKSTGKGLEWHE